MVLLLIGAYSLVGIIVGCRIAAFAAWTFAVGAERKYPGLCEGNSQAPNGDQWLGGAMWGAVAAVVWPAVLFAVVGRAHLLAPPKTIRDQQQRAHTARLERELGLVEVEAVTKTVPTKA